MHTFRLLEMAKEIALTGQVNVKRTNREELLNIKKGRYTYDVLLAKAESLKIEVIELFNTCDLQNNPDYNFVENKL